MLVLVLFYTSPIYLPDLPTCQNEHVPKTIQQPPQPKQGADAIRTAPRIEELSTALMNSEQSLRAELGKLEPHALVARLAGRVGLGWCEVVGLVGWLVGFGWFC